MTELDAYSSLKSLGKYLRAELEVFHGIIDLRIKGGPEKWQTMQGAGHKITITVSNSAPTEPRWPAVVFTGVGLGVESEKYRGRMFWGNPHTERFRSTLENGYHKRPLRMTIP